MAGALGLRLAGPRIYGGVLVDDHWMGDGRVEATAQDIDRAGQLRELEFQRADPVTQLLACDAKRLATGLDHDV